MEERVLESVGPPGTREHVQGSTDVPVQARYPQKGGKWKETKNPSNKQTFSLILAHLCAVFTTLISSFFISRL